MNTIWRQILADEAGQQVEVCRLIGRKHHGEARRDLSKTSLVPVGSVSEKRWSNQDLEKRIENASETASIMRCHEHDPSIMKPTMLLLDNEVITKCYLWQEH